MKCNKCGTINNEGAKFCRSCGAELITTSADNIMNRFPEYHFEPTNLIKWKKPVIARFILVLLCLFLQLPLILLYLIFFNLHLFPKNKVELKSLADYIQHYDLKGPYLKSKKIYVFFVKNGKFGVMDVAHYEVQIPAEYDVLSWKEKNEFLIAERNGRKFFIDINNVELK